MQMKYLSSEMSEYEYSKARQTVLANRLYNRMGIPVDLYRRFAAHIGIVLVYGARANKRPRQVEVHSGKGKTFIYLTIDARNIGFFADPAGLKPVKQENIPPSGMFLPMWLVLMH